VLDIFKKLTEVMITFYQETLAPSILKQCILKLIARNVCKLRLFYQTLQRSGKMTEEINQ
jgi:hypothetical protein